MSFIDVNEIKIHYKTTGSGDQVILIHGLSDTLNFWEPLTSNFLTSYKTTPQPIFEDMVNQVKTLKFPSNS